MLAVTGLLVTSGCTWLADRSRDAADTVRLAIGVGPGLAVDARVTDWISPGLGVVTYTRNWGWLDRNVHGSWLESDVINTPRLAYEAAGAELESRPLKQSDPRMSLARLAASSLNLPNERWIRSDGVATVEYFAFLNGFGAGESSRAHWLADFVVEPGETVFVPSRTPWQKGFVEVGTTALLVHARVGFNPLELIDFLAGWFGLDPAGDDARVPYYPLLPREDPARARVEALFDGSPPTDRR